MDRDMLRAAAFVVVLIGLIAGWLPAETLPDAPYMSATTVHNSTSYATIRPEKQKTLDWTFLTAHGVYGASLAFDLYLTRQGVGHGCEEASGALGPYPSTGRIVGYGVAEFAAVTLGDYGLKRLAEHAGAPHWLQNTAGTLAASIGTFKHVRGGRQWLRTNCL